MSTQTEGTRVELPLVRAAIYDTLAMGFAYPDAESLVRFRQVAALAAIEAGTLSPEMATLVEAVEGPAWEIPRVELEGEHSRLFSGEVVCSPYETEYETDPFAKSRQLADISGFYRAWGVEPSSDRRMMPDFISTELEFMALLCRKEAYAIQNSWDDRASLATEAQSAFLGSHLGRWFELFVGTVRVSASPEAGRLFSSLAALLETFVRAELASMGLDPRRLKRRMVSDGALPACDPRVAGGTAAGC